jgi:undecaprenyl-diphosphatase
LIWAVLMAFSRLYLYVHWPTDVLGGIFLGVTVGWLGANLVQRGETYLKCKKAGQ